MNNLEIQQLHFQTRNFRLNSILKWVNFWIIYLFREAVVDIKLLIYLCVLFNGWNSVIGVFFRYTFIHLLWTDVHRNTPWRFLKISFDIFEKLRCTSRNVRCTYARRKKTPVYIRLFDIYINLYCLIDKSKLFYY